MVPMNQLIPANNSLSIYVHWPFCLSKCPYCDFNSHVVESVDHSAWTEAYITELEYFKNILKGRNIRSVFFGGGTPSLMDPNTVSEILKWIYNNASDYIEEVTLEANPTSIENYKLKAFFEAGVNRLSVGVQSLVKDDLKKLGRTHTAKSAEVALTIAKEIFDSYSFDLIYAREGQTLDMWQNELKKAMKLAGGHISLYQLTIEKGTPFYALHKEEKLILPPNEVAATMYSWTTEYLRDLGYKRYEISNYALENHECLHNLTYWHYGEYLGIGPGAHSRICMEGNNTPSALMNYNSPSKWMNHVMVNNHAIQINDILTERELIEEILMMGLRLETGITDRMLIKYTGLGFKDILDKKSLHTLVSNEFVNFDGKILKLTDKGMLMHNYIVPRLI